MRKNHGERIEKLTTQVNTIADCHAEKKHLVPLAKIVTVAVVIIGVLGGITQVPLLASYPGTNSDLLMKVASVTFVYGVTISVFKYIVMLKFGVYIENKMETFRIVNIRDLFNKEVRWPIIIGGGLQSLYNVWFRLLIPFLAPAILSGGMSVVIIFLGIVEIFANVLRKDRATIVRLIVSGVITLIGLAIITLGNKDNLISPPAALHVNATLLTWGFLGWVGPGNFLLAIAEYQETKGVHGKETAAAVYTLGRYISYALGALVLIIVWGIFHPGSFQVFGSVIVMCISRWYYIFPVAVLGGFQDLFRICTKAVVSTTYFYIVNSLGVILATALQTVAFLLWPTTFSQVTGGLVLFVTCIIGGVVIGFASTKFPHS